MSFQGITKIELKDIKTGKIETIEKHNIVTNALDKILSQNPFGAVSYEKLLPATNLLGGIACFENQCGPFVENNIINFGNPITAYAQNNANSGSDTKRGSYSPSETAMIDENGMHYVWEWTSAQGNGKISCVSLTNPLINATIPSFKSFIDVTQEDASGYPIISLTEAGAKNYIGGAQGVNATTGAWYKLIPVSPSSNICYKLKLRRAYRNPFTYSLLQNNSAKANSLFCYNINETEISLINPIPCGPDCTTSMSSATYINDKFYIFSITDNSNSVLITEINLSSDHYGETLQNTIQISGSKIGCIGYYQDDARIFKDTIPYISNYIYVPLYSAKKDSKTFLRINVSNPSDVKQLGDCQQVIKYGDDASGVIFDSVNSVPIWFMSCNSTVSDSIKGFQISGDKASSFNLASGVTEASSFKNLFNLNGYLLYENYTNAKIYHRLAAPTFYMATVNNLSSSITKTSDKSMKITYVIRKTK